MLGITDLKNGTVFQENGVPYKVINYAQKQMGRGGSIVNVKIKNLLDGSVLDKTFKGSDKIEPADVMHKKVQFLYEGGETLHFMDEDTYEQFEISKSTVGDSHVFLKEGANADAQLFEGRVINVELPIKVPLEVIEAPDVVKGDTQSTVMKTCVVETGTEVQTPIFVKKGDVVIIDTRDGKYVERQK